MSERQIPGQLDIYGQEEPPAPCRPSATLKAVNEVVSHARGMRQQVLDALFRYGGMTDQQIAEATGMPENSVRPRRIELAKNGQIRPGGKQKTRSGRDATLWVAVTTRKDAL